MERLTTGRLLLRAFESEDLQSLYAYCSEPDTGIHADKKPHESIEESRQLLNQLMQEDLTWAICDKVSGKNIGAVWLREDHRRRRDKSRCRVLGYLLDKGWWGQGLMTEAVSCVVDYAFKNLQLELISTYRFSYNHRSGRVMDKTGFVYEGTLRQATERFDGALLDVSCFSQTRQEWQDRQRKQEDRKMRWKRLLFDLDGTITDPKVGITKSVQYALEAFGIIESDADRLTPFIGPPLQESFEQFYQMSKEQAKQAVEKYRERFSTVGLYENEIYPGMAQLLSELCAQGCTLAVASSKPTVFVKKILEHFQIECRFLADRQSAAAQLLIAAALSAERLVHRLAQRAQVAAGICRAAQSIGEHLALAGEQCADHLAVLAQLCSKAFQLIGRKAVVPYKNQTVAAKRLGICHQLLCQQGEQLFIFGGQLLLFGSQLRL